jgi:hypothetical protein
MKKHEKGNAQTVEYFFHYLTQVFIFIQDAGDV